MASPTPSAPEVPPSSINPLLGVFTAPSAAMAELIRRPRFLLPLLLTTVIGATVMTIAMQRGAIEHSLRQKFESNPRFEQMPPQQRAAVIDRALKFSSYSIVGGAVVGPLVGLALTSGVLLLLSNVLLGAQARFKQMMGIVAHAWLPLCLHGLIAIPILLAKDPEAVDIQNVVPLSNLSPLFDVAQQPKAYAVATAIDLFSFWVMALLAIGLAQLTKKSMGTALAVILVPWALYVVIFKALLG